RSCGGAPPTSSTGGARSREAGECSRTPWRGGGGPPPRRARGGTTARRPPWAGSWGAPSPPSGGRCGRAPGGPRRWCCGGRGRALALAVAGRAEEALALIAEGWALHESLPADLDRPGLSLLLFTEVVALGELGRMADAVAAADRIRATRPGAPTSAWIALAE